MPPPYVFVKLTIPNFSHGAQLLGITNYSSEAESTEALRHCAWKGGPPAATLAEAAQRRLTQFKFVGLFNKLHQTVSLAAATLGFSLNGTAYKVGLASCSFCPLGIQILRATISNSQVGQFASGKLRHRRS
eukprot:5626453-Pyramimonas_sp.AAC.1